MNKPIINKQQQELAAKIQVSGHIINTDLFDKLDTI